MDKMAGPAAAVDFVSQVFGPGTLCPVYLSSLPNGDAKDREPGEKCVTTRDMPTVARFVAKWDRKDRGSYFCVATLQPDARPDRAGGSVRSKSNVAEITTLHTDTDLKDVESDLAQIFANAEMLPHPPSVAISSGNGAHLHWLLKEGLEATPENIERVEAVLRQLADLVGGDLQCAEVSRLMRIPGSHNTKNGEWKPVEIVSANYDRRYELSDIEEMLSYCSPIVWRKAKLTNPGNSESQETNPFLEAAKLLGFKPPIDVEQRLAAMAYQGQGEASIHWTQVSVTAALLSRGVPLDEVVEGVLEATRAAAGEMGTRWNWVREERSLRRMCEGWLKKNPPKLERGPALVDQKPFVEQNQEDTVADNPKMLASGGASVVNLQERRAKGQLNKTAVHIVVGTAVIDAMKAGGGDLIITQKAAWRYADGLWTMNTDGIRSWLEVEIETACRELGLQTVIKLVAESRQWIMRNPGLWREKIAWDAHGKIPTRSGLVDPKSLEVMPAAPEHYCTWRVDSEFIPDATCPWWEVMIADAFGDRSPVVAGELAGTIQEVLGAGLIDIKPRALSKALILQGGSNFGKSGLLEVLSGLFGSEVVSTSLEALEGAHGLMGFLKRAPWVLHEAFDQSRWHLSSIVKSIITGEPVHVNVKNGPMLSVRVRAPIFWATNHPPKFREATKAIVNRLIMIRCRREFKEGHEIGAAAEALRRGYDSPAALVLDIERAGLLNWAIAGLQRAKGRGMIQVNDEIRDMAEEVRRDSNLVAGFLEECVEYNPDMRVSVPDFCAAFAVWYLENKGEDRRIPSNDSISKAVLAMSDDRIAYHSKDLRDNMRRYYAGIVLSEQGVIFWQRAVSAQFFEGKTASTTSADGRVNTEIPVAWKDRPSIIEMRRCHLSGVTCFVAPAKSDTTPSSDTDSRVSLDQMSLGQTSDTGQVTPPHVTVNLKETRF